MKKNEEIFNLPLTKKETKEVALGLYQLLGKKKHLEVKN